MLEGFRQEIKVRFIFIIKVAISFDFDECVVGLNANLNKIAFLVTITHGKVEMLPIIF